MFKDHHMRLTAHIAHNKFFRFIIGLVVVVVFLITLVAAAHKQSSSPLTGMEVVLNNDALYHFLQKKDIEQLLVKSREIDVLHTSIDKLDLKKMEEIARTHPWVADANIFIDGRRRLQVHVQQRVPLARIFDNSGKSYYVSEDKHQMPVVKGYNYPTPVFTNVPLSIGDSLNRQVSEKIIALGRLIGADSFWNAQITQIEVQPDQTFVLIPLVGGQRILFGGIEEAKHKLDNLFDFYQQVSTRIGWDKYEVLDLRYKGQIVATPSIGWVAPKVLDTLAPLPPPPADTLPRTVSAPAAVAVKTPATAKPQATKPAATVAVKSGQPKAQQPAATQARKNNQVTNHKKQPSPGAKEKADKPKYLYPGNNQ